MRSDASGVDIFSGASGLMKIASPGVRQAGKEDAVAKGIGNCVSQPCASLLNPQAAWFEGKLSRKTIQSKPGQDRNLESANAGRDAGSANVPCKDRVPAFVTLSQSTEPAGT